ncbi:hypothetical protein, conserved [Trypanosoma brucei gambiense DAL972]|uniref:Uncharacterized protein n=2 Tax=Trypanosoma brucei TaxID=5691 RepID=C9ZL73_TRYB9|nr:hypothetical protein, conserved [Trypanosoma brucei gambiense DAL972]RHW73919.1 hypothetical protein DPX39_030038100 [Trypanosoma brucei equiperdum]CBH10082.1 hypothetical protein, conserved [Trypanosoma brucei gambiense DAL972]|eukprot:XP_011772372.1 hypothetical protein, conserved [Trypanosoma brucei gambiense DAL972]
MSNREPMSPLPTQPTSVPSVASLKGVLTPQVVLQTAQASLELPKADEMWSNWYKESEDRFLDFISFDATEGGGNGGVVRSGSSHRTLSARRISGQFEEEVMKSWEEDWEDEDVEDTFDAVMGRIGRYEASRAASSQK